MEMIEKRLAGLPFSLFFWILSSWNGREGARAPNLTKGQCLGSVRFGRSVRLKRGPVEFSYGFHITRLVWISVSFLATIPPWFWGKGSAGNLKWGLHVQRQPRVQGQENASWVCAELPRMVPSSDCLLALHPRLPGSGVSWPPKDSVMSTRSS